MKAAIDDQNASMMNQDHRRNRGSADQTMIVIVGAKAAAVVGDRITTRMGTVATVHRHQARDTVDHRRTGKFWALFCSLMVFYIEEVYHLISCLGN